jgi:endonuclease/exonuclease/phosphatase family metal-dependent hydrolase
VKNLIVKILKFISYIFAALLLISYLSVYISPRFFWPLAFFGLLYPYLLAVNFFLFVFWLFKWKKILFIPLIVLILGFNPIRNTVPNFFRTNPEIQRENKAQLKVLSYNVRGFNIYEWLNDPNTNKGIFNFIRSEHPDVICIQEFYTSNKYEFSPERYSDLFGETPHSYIEFSDKHSDNKGFGVATFSRYPILNTGLLFKKGGNQAIFTDILYHEDTIRIFNSHLQSINLKAHNYQFLDSLKIRYDEEQLREVKDISRRLKWAYIKRSEQADQLSEAIKNSPHPVVVCGDFNDTPVSYTYRKIKNKMKDAWVVAGTGFGSTYQGFTSFRIDYILYDNHFKAVDFERVKTKLSDHYPILTILRKKDN